MPGDCPPQETGEHDGQPEPQLVPAAEQVTRLTPDRRARMRSGRNRSLYIVAGITAAATLVAAAVAGIIAAVGVWPLRSAPAGPWTRLAVQPLDRGYRHPLAAITIPAASLQPELAQWFGGRVAAGGSVTGYELRSAYPASPSLCLTAVTDSPAAGRTAAGSRRPRAPGPRPARSGSLSSTRPAAPVTRGWPTTSTSPSGFSSARETTPWTQTINPCKAASPSPQ